MIEKDFLDHIKGMGSNIKGMMKVCASSEAVLTGLLARSDEMPKGMFEQMEESLSDVRKGRADMNKSLKDMEKIYSKNGDNSTK